MNVWDQILNLLLSPSVSEVVSNGKDSFFIKDKGKYIPINMQGRFKNEEEYTEAIRNGLGRYVKSPYPFDANLYEGPLNYTGMNQEGKRVSIRGRCHIALPPVCTTPLVTIAKKSEELRTLTALASTGTFDGEIHDFLEAAMKTKLTIVILGKTGAGKTTFLESLASEIDYNDRIGVGEDTPELALKQPNVSYLNSVPWSPGFDPNEVAPFDWVVSQFQRMRVDRLIVGETRGKEFSDFLTAANSGIEGCLTTLHANNSTEGIRKMTTYATLGSPGLDVRTINQSIATAVDLIIQLTVEGNKHRIEEITEVTSVVSQDSDARPTTSTLYRYIPETDSFIRPGIPTEKMYQRFGAAGIDLRALQTSPVVIDRKN